MIRRIASISASTIAGQLIQVAVFLVLARMLSPEDFGPYGAFLAFLALTTSAGALRYEMAFNLVPEVDRLWSVALVVAQSAFVLGVVAGGGVWMALRAGDIGEGLIPSWGGATIFFIVAIGTISLLLGESLAYLCLRLNRTYPIAAYSLVRPVSIGLCQYVLVSLTSLQPDQGLIIGAVVGQAVALTAYGKVAIQASALAESVFGRAAWRLAADTAKRYAYLVRSHVPQQVMSRLGLNSLPIALPGFFGPAVGGWYVASNRVLCTPSQVFGKALRGVYFAEAARRVRDGEGLLRLHAIATATIAIASIFFFGSIAIFSDRVLELLFGDQWIAAAPMMSLLAVFWWSAISNIPSTALIAPLGLDAWYAKYEGVLLGSRIASIAVGIAARDPIVLVGVFSVSGAALNLWLIMNVRRMIHRRECYDY